MAGAWGRRWERIPAPAGREASRTASRPAPGLAALVFLHRATRNLNPWGARGSGPFPAMAGWDNPRSKHASMARGLAARPPPQPRGSRFPLVPFRLMRSCQPRALRAHRDAGGAPSHPPLSRSPLGPRRPSGAGEVPAAGPGAGWVLWACAPPGVILPHDHGPLPPALGHKSAWPWVLVRSPPPAGAPHLPAGSLSPGVLSAAGVPLISTVTF